MIYVRREVMVHLVLNHFNIIDYKLEKLNNNIVHQVKKAALKISNQQRQLLFLNID
jgi:hypothetical protein